MEAVAVTSALASYVLRHGDDSLIMAQRLSEWISRGPELEEDLALANVALDHLGVAQHLLRYAGQVDGRGHTDDELAFLRTERGYTNLLLVEQPNGDFGQTMAKLLFFDTYQLLLWDALCRSGDETISGIAAKAVKEARYHARHSEVWVVRLGDGTDESHRRMQAGVDAMWRYVAEAFEVDDLDQDMIDQGVGVDLAALRPEWDRRVDAVLAEATLERPADPYRRTGGRDGFHTEHLGHLLGEMQWMQRTYPGLEW